MWTLKGELITNNEVIKTCEQGYCDTKGFFLAYVTICDELNIDIPFWTSVEERQMEKKGEVVFELNDHEKFVLKEVMDIR